MKHSQLCRERHALSCAGAALLMACHLVIQFVAWAYAMYEPVVGQIVSFPTFAIISVDFSTRHFGSCLSRTVPSGRWLFTIA